MKKKGLGTYIPFYLFNEVSLTQMGLRFGTNKYQPENGFKHVNFISTKR